MPRIGPKQFDLGEIQIENQDTNSHRVTVTVLNQSDVVFLDSVTAFPAEWDGNDLVRQGGAVLNDPVSELGHYTVHVRIEDGPIQTFPVADIVSNGGCVSVRPNIERGGGFHFEYAYCSGT